MRAEEERERERREQAEGGGGGEGGDEEKETQEAEVGLWTSEEEELSSPVLLNDQQRLVAGALFRGLQGKDMSNVVAEPALTERVTVAALSRVTNELGLEHADADLVGDMIAFHDTSGNNSLSFADFLRIVRTAGPSVLDLDGGGSARRR